MGGTSEADHTERVACSGGGVSRVRRWPACLLPGTPQATPFLPDTVSRLGRWVSWPAWIGEGREDGGRRPCRSQGSRSLAWPRHRLHPDLHARWHAWSAWVWPALQALLGSLFADKDTEAPRGAARGPSGAKLGRSPPATFTPHPRASCRRTSLAQPLGAQLSCVDSPALLDQASSLNVQAGPDRTRPPGLDHKMLLT